MAKLASPNLRNGLKWREGRPRFEPSPAMRKLGVKGRDLKDLAGAWIADRGLATTLCDDRLQWARSIRDAMAPGAAGIEARARLTIVLDMLPSPRDDTGRLRRDNVADLIEKARALLEQRPEEAIAAGGGRTITALIDAYFNEPPPLIASGSLRIYRIQSRRLIEKFGKIRVSEVTTGMLYAWYQDLYKETSSHTAASVMGATTSFFRWAVRHDWISQSPAQKIGVEKPAGRRVFWPFAMEKAFVEWCDANNYEDVADAIVMGCWTGARQVDMVKASLEDLSGQTWRFTPQKTQRKKLEALPGIMPAVRARIERRRIAAGNDVVRKLHKNTTPFLYDHRNHTEHTSATIGYAFQKARYHAAKDAAAGLWPDLAGLTGKRLQDARDTCVTRLFLANVPFASIPPWTGHSLDSAKEILTEHYKVILDEEALETARIYQSYANAQGFAL